MTTYDMILIPRAELQQALEALEVFFAYGYNREECIQIIAALRERLAQEGEPSAEPVRQQLSKIDLDYWVSGRAQIIEALEKAGFTLMSNADGFWLQPSKQAEPVAWQDTAKPEEIVPAHKWQSIDPMWHWMYRPLYATPQTKPEQAEPVSAVKDSLTPEQEPVAWHHPDCKGECIACLIERTVQEYYGTQGLSYLRDHVTATPKRTPLTDAEIRKCAQAMDAEPLAEGWTELIKFARAIERAHGIGEKK